MQVQAYPHGMERGCIGDEEVCSQAGTQETATAAGRPDLGTAGHTLLTAQALQVLCEPDPPVRLVQVSKTMGHLSPLTRTSQATACRSGGCSTSCCCAVHTPAQAASEKKCEQGTPVVQWVQRQQVLCPQNCQPAEQSGRRHMLACKVEGPPGPPHNGHAALVKVAVLASLEVVCRVTAAVASEHWLGVVALGALHTGLYGRSVPAL